MPSKVPSRADAIMGVYLYPLGTLMDEGRLHAALAAALGRDDVDLVTLHQASLWPQYRILGEGALAFTRERAGADRVPRKVGGGAGGEPQLSS